MVATDYDAALDLTSGHGRMAYALMQYVTGFDSRFLEAIWAFRWANAERAELVRERWVTLFDDNISHEIQNTEIINAFRFRYNQIGEAFMSDRDAALDLASQGGSTVVSTRSPFGPPWTNSAGSTGGRLAVVEEEVVGDVGAEGDNVRATPEEQPISVAIGIRNAGVAAALGSGAINLQSSPEERQPEVSRQLRKSQSGIQIAQRAER